MSLHSPVKRPGRVLRDVPPAGQGVRSGSLKVRRDVPATSGARRLHWDLNRAWAGPTRLRIKKPLGAPGTFGRTAVLDLSFSGELEPARYFDSAQVWAYEFGAKTPEGALLVAIDEKRLGVELHGDLFTLGSVRHEFFVDDALASGYHPASPDMSPAALGLAVDALAVSGPCRWIAYRGWIEEAMVRISAVAQAIPSLGAEPGFAAVAPQNLLRIKSASGRRAWSAAATKAVAEARIGLDQAVRAYFQVDAKTGNEEG